MFFIRDAQKYSNWILTDFHFILIGFARPFCTLVLLRLIEIHKKFLYAKRINYLCKFNTAITMYASKYILKFCAKKNSWRVFFTEYTLNNELDERGKMQNMDWFWRFSLENAYVSSTS